MASRAIDRVADALDCPEWAAVCQARWAVSRQGDEQRRNQALQATAEGEEALNPYHERLHAALQGRFALMDREGHAVNHNGIGLPQVGERYSWRFWNAEGTRVWQDSSCKFRDGMEFSAEVGCEFPLPGDFTQQLRWHEIGGATTYNGRTGFGAGEMWDAMWNWRFRGTTRLPMLDSALGTLASTAAQPRVWSLLAHSRLPRDCQQVAVTLMMIHRRGAEHGGSLPLWQLDKGVLLLIISLLPTHAWEDGHVAGHNSLVKVCLLPSCTNAASHRCSKCRIARYCSRECQSRDWGRHKRECKQWLKGKDE